MKYRNARYATIRSISNVLDRDPAAMQIMAHATSVLKAGRIYQRIAPPALARVSRVANLKAGTIIIHADHGAAANKLKQQTHYLMGEFLKKGLECNGIEIRVQPSAIEETETIATQKPLSEQALTSLGETAKKMRAGSPLKEKLEYLISHVARR
jgi:hypothetical protein